MGFCLVSGPCLIDKMKAINGFICVPVIYANAHFSSLIFWKIIHVLSIITCFVIVFSSTNVGLVLKYK